MVPAKWRFETTLAVRHLTTGGGQTLLTMGAVAAGVIVIIFLTALIFGMRARLTDMLTEAIPHVTVRVREHEPVPLSEIQNLEDRMSSSRIERQAPQLKFIDDWQHVVDLIRTTSECADCAAGGAGTGVCFEGWESTWRDGGGRGPGAAG